jgi:hypothetical protein
MKRTCCFVDCPKDAEYEIHDQGERRPGVGATDSCKDHVGDLIGSVIPTKPTGPWIVVVVDKPVKMDDPKQS